MIGRDQCAGFKARQLHVGYGDRLVLRGLDYEFASNRTSVVLGPGGAGKTTLLRALLDSSVELGLWHKGELHLPSAPSFHLRQKVECSYTTIAAMLKDGQDMIGNDDLPAMIRGFWGADLAAAETLNSILDVPVIDLPTWQLRLATFMSLTAHESGCLLLDEPTADMDDEARGWVIRKLKEIRGTRTIVLVTHHLKVARSVGDDIFLIVEGEICEAAPVDQFFESAQNPRARHFALMGC